MLRLWKLPEMFKVIRKKAVLCESFVICAAQIEGLHFNWFRLVEFLFYT